MLKKSLVTIITLLFLASCNTISGAGEDIEKAGDAIENSAQKHKPY